MNRYHACVIALLLPFTVFGPVMLLSSMNFEPKCVCADCSFSTLVFMDIMLAACCYYCDRVLLLSACGIEPRSF